MYMQVKMYCDFWKANTIERFAQKYSYLYLRVNNANPHYAFVDFCSSNSSNSDNLKFRYFLKPTDNKGYYSFLNCSQTITDENNEQQWQTVPTSFDYFKCAKLKDECDKFIVCFIVYINFYW